jgi:uncharacterized protein (DUF305 family)
MKLITKMLAGAGALAIAACSGGEQNAQPAVEETTASSMANDPNNPFGAVEMEMHEKMVAATGANASETWLKKMIEHHRGAVTMSELLIDRGGEPRFVEMAQATVSKQQKEIGELERTLAAGITGGAGEANPFGAVEKSMHAEMMGAKGADLAETWARKMIAHHRGAVQMCEVLLKQGGNAQVLKLAQRTANDQRAEIEHLEAMLRGEAMTAEKEATSTTSKKSEAVSTAPTSRASAAAKTSPAAKAGQPKQAATKSSPKPTTSPSAAAECAPEHREMGHC